MNNRGLSFDLRFSAHGAEELVTSAEFRVSCDGEAFWPVFGAQDIFIEIQIDDLLSHFVECWQPLNLRQTFPIASNTGRPSQLRAEAEQRWEGEPSERAAQEDISILKFEDVHDISRCFAGYFDLPSLWFFRRGDKMVVDTHAAMRIVDFDAALNEITNLGNSIAARLTKCGKRWSRLVDRWEQRGNADPTSLLVWSTSLARGVVEELVEEGILTAPQSLTEAVNDNDELRIAARMASALPPDQVRKILAIVRSFRSNPSPELDSLSASASAHVENTYMNRRAHEQGEAAARFVREWLQMPNVDVFDIVGVMRRLGILLYSKSVEPHSLRALAVWGSKYGPAVLINTRSVLESLDTPNSRVNLAHELCHHLLDRGHALGAVEILNSRMPLDIERRAKAFAGELLLPTARASEEWQRAQSPKSLDQLRTLIHRLRKEFGVTKSVASWKLEHAAREADCDITMLLDMIVPHR